MTIQTIDSNLHAKQEEMQLITLSALSKAGFFDEAVFYGGTNLRLLRGLNRFSEDLDFSLLTKDGSFSLEKYFPFIEAEFSSYGRSVVITRKEKQSFGKVQSAFLKDETDVWNIKFQTIRSPKIKIEIDYMPPLSFDTERLCTSTAERIPIRSMTLPCLFAGKMNALMFRAWGSRVKGRDWYDFDWYIKNDIPLDFGHYRERLLDFNGIITDENSFRSGLVQKILSTDFEQAREDVISFIDNETELDDWSPSYFLGLAKKLNILEPPANREIPGIFDSIERRFPSSTIQSAIKLEHDRKRTGMLFQIQYNHDIIYSVVDDATGDISWTRDKTSPNTLHFATWKTLKDNSPAVASNGRVVSVRRIGLSKGRKD